MSTLNIVSIIEDNPIRSLTPKTNNLLINKLKDNFTTTEQQLFIGSFYCYLNHNSTSDYVIDLDGVWKWLGFSRVDPLVRLLKNNFKEGEDYKVEKPAPQNGGAGSGRNLGGAGLNKEKIMMNIKTFKKLCLKSRTTKADEIHDYYIKLEEIIQETMQEQSEEFEFELKEKQKQIEKNDEDKLLERHNLLLKLFSNKKCIYLVKLLDDKVKIGSTYQVEERIKSIKYQFGGDGILLDVFECQDYTIVEKNILNDTIISDNKYTYKLETGHMSREVVQLNSQFNYAQLLEIVEKYVNSSKVYFTPAQQIEMKRLQLMESGKLVQDASCNCVNSLILNEILEKINKLSGLNNEPKKREIPLKSRNFGRKIQQINRNNLNHIIKVHQDMESLLTDTNYATFYETGIRTSITDNTEYKGFRWKFVENGQDPNIVHDIEPTVKTKSSVYCILKLDSEKTRIIEHFPTLVEAAKEAELTKRRLSIIINKKQTHNGFHYVKYSECPEDLIKDYPIVVEFVPQNSIRVKATNPETNEERIFTSLRHAHDEVGIHHKTTRRAIANKTKSHGYMWELY